MQLSLRTPQPTTIHPVRATILQGLWRIGITQSSNTGNYLKSKEMNSGDFVAREVTSAREHRAITAAVTATTSHPTTTKPTRDSSGRLQVSSLKYWNRETLYLKNHQFQYLEDMEPTTPPTGTTQPSPGSPVILREDETGRQGIICLLHLSEH